MQESSISIVPLVIPPSGRWLGNDGSWSTFYVHGGNPSQNFHVLPSFNGQNVFLPASQDCEGVPASDCGASRGAEIFASKPSPGFQTNESSTWTTLGYYELNQDDAYGLHGNTWYGYDSVGVSFASGEHNNVTLDRQVLAAYESHDYWLGQLGLSNFAITLNESEHPSSFLTALKEQDHIPSLSFGYQPGASHVYTKVPGSLILGGYDESRRSNDSLLLSSTENVQVGLQLITATTTNATNTLMAEGIIALIDPVVPELWLPPSVCDEIATTFGLTYHNASDRYVLTTPARTALEQLNPSMKFVLGTSVAGGSTITIEVPYKAFDLEASYPIFASATNYFPLRRAANESQYALGRAFMQHVYIVVDWERDIFNLSQALFSAPMPEPNIITIPPKLSRTKHEGGSNRDTLSVGAITGIAIGCTLVLLVAILGCWLRQRRRNRQTERLSIQASHATASPNVAKMSTVSGLALNSHVRSREGAELEGDQYHPLEIASPQRRHSAHEMVHDEERQPVELDVPTVTYELHGINNT